MYMYASSRQNKHHANKKRKKLTAIYIREGNSRRYTATTKLFS